MLLKLVWKLRDAGRDLCHNTDIRKAIILSARDAPRASYTLHGYVTWFRTLTQKLVRICHLDSGHILGHSAYTQWKHDHCTSKLKAYIATGRHSRVITTVVQFVMVISAISTVNLCYTTVLSRKNIYPLIKHLERNQVLKLVLWWVKFSIAITDGSTGHISGD